MDQPTDLPDAPQEQQPRPSPALSPQPGRYDQPQHPLPGNPPVMPEPTPPGPIPQTLP